MLQYIADAFTDTLLAATNGLTREAYYDGGDMIAVIDNEEDLAALVPDYDAMCKVDGRGLIITAKSKDYDFVSRCFYPKLNVPEDPVTGSAHTYLTPLWADKLGKTDMIARQLSPAAAPSTSNWELNASTSQAKPSSSCKARSRLTSRPTCPTCLADTHVMPDLIGHLSREFRWKQKKASHLG